MQTLFAGRTKHPGEIDHVALEVSQDRLNLLTVRALLGTDGELHWLWEFLLRDLFFS